MKMSHLRHNNYVKPLTLLLVPYLFLVLFAPFLHTCTSAGYCHAEHLSPQRADKAQVYVTSEPREVSRDICMACAWVAASITTIQACVDVSWEQLVSPLSRRFQAHHYSSPIAIISIRAPPVLLFT